MRYTVGGARTAPRLAQPVEKFVGAGRRRGIQDQAEYVPAQFRQVRAAMRADRLARSSRLSVRREKSLPAMRSPFACA